MRKLVLQVQMSADGFIAGPDGEMDWMVWDWDDELKEYTKAITLAFDTILLGRKLAEGFVGAWEAQAALPEADEFTHKINDTPKIVFSRTLQSSGWKDTTLAQGTPADVVKTLKSQPGKDIIAYGGAEFVSSLIKEELIDEFHLFVNPAAIGKGLSIFGTHEGYQKLKLIQAKGFSCGITVLHYQKQ